MIFTADRCPCCLRCERHRADPPSVLGWIRFRVLFVVSPLDPFLLQPSGWWRGCSCPSVVCPGPDSLPGTSQPDGCWVNTGPKHGPRPARLEGCVYVGDGRRDVARSLRHKSAAGVNMSGLHLAGESSVCPPHLRTWALPLCLGMEGGSKVRAAGYMTVTCSFKGWWRSILPPTVQLWGRFEMTKK